MTASNYSGQYLHGHDFRIKTRLGANIANTSGDLIAGELLLETGDNGAGVVTGKLYGATITSAGSAAGSYTLLGTSTGIGGGAGGESLWSGSAGSDIYYTGGNVGVGTDDPHGLFSVSGGAYLERAYITGALGQWMQITGTDGGVIAGVPGGSPGHVQFNLDNTNFGGEPYFIYDPTYNFVSGASGIFDYFSGHTGYFRDYASGATGEWDFTTGSTGHWEEEVIVGTGCNLLVASGCEVDVFGNLYVQGAGTGILIMGGDWDGFYEQNSTHIGFPVYINNSVENPTTGSMAVYYHVDSGRWLQSVSGVGVITGGVANIGTEAFPWQATWPDFTVIPSGSGCSGCLPSGGLISGWMGVHDFFSGNSGHVRSEVIVGTGDNLFRAQNELVEISGELRVSGEVWITGSDGQFCQVECGGGEAGGNDHATEAFVMFMR